MPKRGPFAGLPCPWQRPDDVCSLLSQLRASDGPSILVAHVQKLSPGDFGVQAPSCSEGGQCTAVSLPRCSRHCPYIAAALQVTVQVLAVPRETLAVIMGCPESHVS